MGDGCFIGPLQRTRQLGSRRVEFFLLKFYCDWTMHPDIDRSPTGASILADAHNIIADHLQKQDNATLKAELNAALSLDTVRNQLNELLA
jgi:hypothetical protein